jgi:arylsulfatase A-like enzyme
MHHAMTRRFFLLLAVLLAVMNPPAAHAADAARKPNILFIFADDLCYETIRSYGLTDIDTPNLDGLAAEGLTFSDCYNMGAWTGAVCVSSRTMLNTGRFLWRAHRVDKTAEQERQAGRFWSEYLKKAGYETYFTGKWHVKANPAKAFDVARHVRGGMPNQTPQGYNRPLPGEPDPWSPFDQKFGGYWQGGTHWSVVVADDAIDYLHMAKKSDKPFFMYIAFNAAHDPRQSPKEYVDKYPLNRIKVPVNFVPEYPWKDAIGCGENLRDEKLAPFPRTEHEVKVHRQEYYALITHMDAQIGRILAALKESGMADNTYIFFTADHGLAVGHHGLLGKQNLFDDSVRVPFMVKGPGVPQGQRNVTPIYMQDVMATTLDLAGIPKPDHVQFNSLMPLVRATSADASGGNSGGAPYDAIYGAYLGLQRSVKQNGYKLIMYPKIAKALLFNLKDDPQEMKDLADDPQNLPRLKALFARFLDLQRDTGDELDLRSVYPALAGGQ